MYMALFWCIYIYIYVYTYDVGYVACISFIYYTFIFFFHLNSQLNRLNTMLRWYNIEIRSRRMVTELTTWSYTILTHCKIASDDFMMQGCDLAGTCWYMKFRHKQIHFEECHLCGKNRIIASEPRICTPQWLGNSSLASCSLWFSGAEGYSRPLTGSRKFIVCERLFLVLCCGSDIINNVSLL